MTFNIFSLCIISIIAFNSVGHLYPKRKMPIYLHYIFYANRGHFLAFTEAVHALLVI